MPISSKTTNPDLLIDGTDAVSFKDGNLVEGLQLLVSIDVRVLAEDRSYNAIEGCRDVTVLYRTVTVLVEDELEDG